MSSLRVHGTEFELALIVQSLGSQPFKVLPDPVNLDSGRRSGLVLEPLGDLRIGPKNCPTGLQVLDLLDRIPACWSQLGELTFVLSFDAMTAMAATREISFEGDRWIFDIGKAPSARSWVRITSFLCLLPVPAEVPV